MQIPTENILILIFVVYSFIVLLEPHIQKSIGVLSVIDLEALVCKMPDHRIATQLPKATSKWNKYIYICTLIALNQSSLE